MHQNTDLINRIQSLEEELEKDQAVVEGLENRITMLAYTRNELSLKVKNLHCDLESKGNTVLCLEERVRELQEDLYKANVHIAELEASMSRKDDVSLRDSARLLVQIAKLQEQVNEKVEEIGSLQHEKDSLIAGMDKLQAQIDELQEQLAAHTSSVGDSALSEADPESSEVSATDDHVGDSNDFEG